MNSKDLPSTPNLRRPRPCAHIYHFTVRKHSLRREYRIELNDVDFKIYIRQRQNEPSNLDTMSEAVQIAKQCWHRLDRRDYRLELLSAAHAAMMFQKGKYTPKSKHVRHNGYCAFGEQLFRFSDHLQ